MVDGVAYSQKSSQQHRKEGGILLGDNGSFQGLSCSCMSYEGGTK